ncbi:MAG: hypothetical protein A4S09_05945 [Proteobacteria bacterium SG_bin7]|nr:MAG: hypothetical protein A4S09_05945 [Proteobacteria bacterium SG_bin7]
MRLFLIFALSSINAHSAVTVTDVQGASNYINTATTTSTGTTTTPSIFGGTAGNLATCSANPDGVTCNNCNAASGPIGTICNEKRINSLNTLRIAVRSTTAAGYPAIYDTTTNNRIPSPINSVFVPVNGTGYVEIPWQNLCPSIPQTIGVTNAQCEFAGQKAFNVGIDKLNNATKDADDDTTQVTIYVSNVVGSTDVTVPSNVAAPQADALFPLTLKRGDEKVYISSFSPGSGFPNTNSGLRFNRYRLYYSTTPIADLALAGAADFDIIGTTSSDISLSPDNVDALTNGTPFYFVGAHIDQAGNMGYFDSTYNSGIGITPDFVFGLLSQDFECFVATATYGSPYTKEVKTLRMFRNYLLEHHRTWAQPLIKFYYEHSPRLANFIRDSEFLKSISRVILWGPIQFAKLSLEHGMSYAFMIFLLPLILLIAIYRWWNVKVVRRT